MGQSWYTFLDPFRKIQRLSDHQLKGEDLCVFVAEGPHNAHVPIARIEKAKNAVSFSL